MLHGTFDESAFGEIDPETGEPAFADDPFGGGCQGQAYEEVYGAQQEMWEKLGPELEELWQRVMADPRFEEADREWVECMADRGYSYDGIDSLYEEVYEDFQRRLDEITGGGGGFGGPVRGLDRGGDRHVLRGEVGGGDRGLLRTGQPAGDWTRSTRTPLLLSSRRR